MTAKELAEFESIIPASAEETFKWHWQPGTMERLIPPWEKVEIIKRALAPQDGETAILRLSAGPLKIDWLAKHRKPEADFEFIDYQESGPFAYWKHHHIIEPIDSDSCRLVDRIEYELPFAALSSPFLGKMVRNKIERMFAFRHEITKQELSSFGKLQGLFQKALLAGSYGFIGRQLKSYLRSQGQQLSLLVSDPDHSRFDKDAARINWDSENEVLDERKISDFDLVIHFAAPQKFCKPGKKAKDAAIRSSQNDEIGFLCRKLAGLSKKPKLVISASFSGCCCEPVDHSVEQNSISECGFQSELCRKWQEATDPASEAGIRVVHLKLGFVISANAGELSMMPMPFASFGAGHNKEELQALNWLSIYDLNSIILHLMLNKSLSGPVNALAPEPVKISQLRKIIAEKTSKPAIMSLPASPSGSFTAEQCENFFLRDARLKPAQLLESAYEFRHANFESCLRFLLGID